ncbi:MAG: response regulator [Desulfobacterales bacterium]|nr:response regulator [Desulfobacterales bacterium]
MIVDSNRLIRQVLANYIDVLGCQVKEFSNSNEFFLELSSIDTTTAPPTWCVIIDMEMYPELISAISNKVEQPSSIFIIVLIPASSTAKFDLKLAENHLTLIKPIKWSSLISCFQTFLFPNSEKNKLISNNISAGQETDSSHISDKYFILFVEDYPTNQKVGMRHLINAGYEVFLAENGYQAVAAFKKQHVDIVLMDIQMPEMDGFKATNLIREWEAETAKQRTISRIPIIAMTAHAMKGYREICIEAGMDDYITKPLNKNGLLSIVEKWVQVSKNMAQSVQSQAISTISQHKELPVMEFQQILNDFDGDINFIQEIIMDFKIMVKDQIGRIHDAFNNHEIETIKREAHSIKGGSANLTAKRLSHAALELEQAVKSEQTESIPMCIQQIETEFENLMIYVEQAIQNQAI